MEGLNFLTVQRGRSGSNSDAEIINIKGSEIPEDVFSAITKEETVNKGNVSRTKEDYIGDEKDSESNEQSKEGKRQQPRRHVSHGYHLVEGKMGHGMEDYLVATSKKLDNLELGLYGIFDGHSGRKVAEYLQDHLFDNILNEADFWTSPNSAIKRAYEATDKDILENVVGFRGGSTAVTAIIIDRKKLGVANVGNSRAVLCRNGVATQITVEHQPLKERGMVESKGGFVSWKPGSVPRVDGQLAMTRAFGDRKVKDHINADPDIATEKIDKDTEFIILASDGLWKVMSNQAAVDCIRGLNNGREAAEELIKEALLRESKDDISCVVVIFHD